MKSHPIVDIFCCDVSCRSFEGLCGVADIFGRGAIIMPDSKLT